MSETILNNFEGLAFILGNLIVNSTTDIKLKYCFSDI